VDDWRQFQSSISYYCLLSCDLDALDRAESGQVIHHAAAEGAEVVAAFEGADDSALAMLVGEVGEDLGHSQEADFGQGHLSEGIVGVGIEAGRD